MMNIFFNCYNINKLLLSYDFLTYIVTLKMDMMMVKLLVHRVRYLGRYLTAPDLLPLDSVRRTVKASKSAKVRSQPLLVSVSLNRLAHSGLIYLFFYIIPFLLQCYQHYSNHFTTIIF